MCVLFLLDHICKHLVLALVIIYLTCW